MASYSLRVKKSAEKELRSIPTTDLPRIVRRMYALATDPRPHGSEKLSGETNYRVRQGDWRVVYSINDAAKMIEIIKIGHRRDVYR